MKLYLRSINFIIMIVVFVFLMFSASFAQKNKPLSLGTSSMGSAFYTISVVIGNILTKEAGIPVGVEPVGGSDATVRRLAAKKIDLGMLNANTAHDAYAGAGMYAKEGKKRIALIAQGQDSLRQIIVRKSSGIKTVSDLVGKKFIGKRRALSEFETITTALLEIYGIDKEKVKILETTESNEACEALKVGAADAAIIPAGVGASFLMDLAYKIDIDILELPPDKLQTLLGRLGPAFHKAKIPANTYKGVTRDIYVPAMSAMIVCREDLSDDNAYEITKAIFTNHAKISNAHALGKEWNLESTLKDQPIPFHPGAVRYFKEIKAWKFK